MPGEPRAPATDAAPIARLAAAVRRAAPEPASRGNDARRLVLAALGGDIGAVPAEPLPGAPANLALPVAGILAALQYDPESLAILVRFVPAAHEQLLSVALRVVPRVPPAAALAHRAWILAMVDALQGFGLRDRLGPFLRALQRAGHFELVAAIRDSDAGERIAAADRWLLDAETACWCGDYDALRAHLDRAPADHGIAADVELLSAIARGMCGDTDAALAAFETLRSRGSPAMRDVAGRWKAELIVRRGSVDSTGERSWWRSLPEALRRRGGAPVERTRTQEAVRQATDHPVVRLVNWIAMLREPDDGRRDVVRDFHEWVIAGLERAGVAGIAPLAAEWRRHGREDTLWRIVAAFGGNRGETTTVVENGRLRALDLRTARQEAVEVQRRLRHVGLDATLRAFAELAAEWPHLVVFRTYSAELLLWAGRYEEAAAIFDEVRRNGVNRWAHVGLGASLAALGRTADAEAAWQEGLRVHHGALPGEASLVYRAEVAIGAGRLDAAGELLRGVLAAKPTRLRGRLLEAELAWLRGDATAGRAALLEAAVTCPGLADADGPLALADLVHDPAAAEDRDAAIARCRSWRAAMRGNSSSWLFTWYDAAGTMHAFVHARPQELALVVDRFERI
jgi:tetratricopeptide (TPR) repeat protein